MITEENLNFFIDLHTAHWLIMILIVSLIFSFLSFFPLFVMRKKN